MTTDIIPYSIINQPLAFLLLIFFFSSSHLLNKQLINQPTHLAKPKPKNQERKDQIKKECPSKPPHPPPNTPA